MLKTSPTQSIFVEKKSVGVCLSLSIIWKKKNGRVCFFLFNIFKAEFFAKTYCLKAVLNTCTRNTTRIHLFIYEEWQMFRLPQKIYILVKIQCTRNAERKSMFRQVSIFLFHVLLIQSKFAPNLVRFQRTFLAIFVCFSCVCTVCFSCVETLWV